MIKIVKNFTKTIVKEPDYTLNSELLICQNRLLVSLQGSCVPSVIAVR